MISDLHAQAAPTASAGGFDIMSLLPLALIFVVFYFFLIRPQQKKVQEQKNLISSLRRGDRVVTSGGIIGLITKVLNDQEVQVEIAEGVRVRVARAMISDVISKTDPVAGYQDDADDSEKKPTASKLAAKKTSSRTKKSA
jgi:preprotein translocase subunit YajC